MILENVTALCEKRGKTIAAVEREAGIGNGTIGKWKAATPNISTLEKVAKVLDVPLSKLLK